MEDHRDDGSFTPFRLRVQRYRCFQEDTELWVRPLTLVYGKNQAGKSSLLRLLPFIADSMREGVRGMDWASPALLGASFKELGFLGPSPSFSPWIRIRTANREPWVEYAVQLTETDEDQPTVNVVRIGARGEERRFDARLAGTPRQGVRETRAPYEGTSCGVEWSGELVFSSFVPTGLPEKPDRDLARVREALVPVKRIQWLHANRIETTAPNMRPCQWCRPDGADLPDLVTGQKEILEAASSWLRSQKNIEQAVFAGRDSRGHAQIELAGVGGERLPLRLAGEGVRAVIPILFSLCAAEAAVPDGPTMLAVEEPEAHLHPTVQVDLMNRLIEAVIAGIPIILETHSVYLLRTLQLAVLEERIAPDRISVCWVGEDPGETGTRVSYPVKVRRDGTLENWLPNTLEEEQALARQILDKRWGRLVKP